MRLVRVRQLLSDLLAIKERGDRLEREVLRLDNKEIDVEKLKRNPRDVNEL